MRFSNATNVATFHATRDGGSRVYAYTKFLIRPHWHKIHARVCVSRTSLRMISRYFADRYQIIPNGIDYSFYAAEAPPMPRAARKARASSGTDPVILVAAAGEIALAVTPYRPMSLATTLVNPAMPSLAAP